MLADDKQSAGRDQAIALHQAGKINEAAAIYEALLRTDPANAEVWGLLSVAQLRLDRSEEALASWRRCLALETDVPLRLRYIANFLLAMERKEKTQDQPMDFLDDLDIPDWPRDAPIDRDSQEMIVALARRLIDLGRRKDAAVRLLDSMLPGVSGDPQLLAAVTSNMIAAGKPEKMLELLRRLTSGAQSGNGVLLIAHAAAATAAERREEAEIMSRQAREAVPVFLSARKPNQRLLIAVLNVAPKIIKYVHSLARLHFFQNVPTTLVAKMNDEFRFLSIFPQVHSAKSVLAALPPPQLIINNWVSAEGLSRTNTLEFISDYADSFRLPIINHPRRACLATRERNAERFADIPGLVVPRVMRILNEPGKRESLVRVIGEELGFPVIIRSLFTQEGMETVKVATPADLAAHLSTVKDPELYAIEYVHNPVPEGAYRKIRAVVIGGELIMFHVRFGPQWNVHRAKDPRNLMAFDTKGTAMAFAEKVLRRPDETLGKPAMTALNEIRLRTPLDYFGIDFDLLPDGRLLFFEANAAMNFAIREKEELPEIIFAVKNAFRRLFENPPAPPLPGRLN